MRILMSSSEVAPFVKVGGLADVVGALPLALEALGHEVVVVCPLYGCVTHREDLRLHKRPLEVRLSQDNTVEAQVWETTLPHSSVRVFFLEYALFFERPEVYDGPWGAHEDNDLRYAFLSQATLDLCSYLNWTPNIIHAHDWPTALIPVLLRTKAGIPSVLKEASTVLTIHNLQHQGMHHERVLDFLDLPRWLFTQDHLEAMGAVNFLKGGIHYADKITTVSRTYAAEIQTPEQGFGLDPLLHKRSSNLIGIVNGIDMHLCNPEIDPLLPYNFSAKDLLGKALCKKELQAFFGFEQDPSVAVFSAIARLYWQKGLDVLADIAEAFVIKMHVQLVVIGSGEPELEERFRQLALKYPKKIAVYVGYRPQLVHLTQAGSNFFIMPSRFEPCGLTQLYAMRYGSVPIVRETGGLLDTVEQYDENALTGTGLRFQDLTPLSLLNTLGWACATYYDRPEAYKILQENALSQNFSWASPAKEYEAVYESAMKVRQG